MSERSFQSSGRGLSPRLIQPACSLLALGLFVVGGFSSGCSGDSSSDAGRAAGSASGERDGGDGDADAVTGSHAGSDGGLLNADFGNTDASVSGFQFPDGAVGDPDASLGDGGTRDPLGDPDDDSCGSIELQPMVNTEVEPGNLLVVFDNSGSMASAWDDSPRWLAAANALRDAVSSLSEYLTVGAIIFPTDSSCEVASLDSASQIRFLPGPTFIAAWDNFMRRNAPSGGTPLGGGMMAADAALAASTLPGQTSVIVLTDGVPGCDTTALTSLPPQWLAQGIRTHVVGLPGAESAVAVLDSIALAGGTTQHLTPDDPRALRRNLASIVSETVVSALPSCTIPLDPPAPNVDDVVVVVTEAGERKNAPRDLGEGGGWTIRDDGGEIELFGAFCDRGLEGAYDRISIELGCVDLPPLDPPIVVVE